MSLPLPILDRGAVLPAAPLQGQAVVRPVEGLVNPQSYFTADYDALPLFVR